MLPGGLLRGGSEQPTPPASLTGPFPRPKWADYLRMDDWRSLGIIDPARAQGMTEQDLVQMVMSARQASATARAPLEREWRRYEDLYHLRYSDPRKQNWQSRVSVPEVQSKLRVTLSQLQGVLLDAPKWFQVIDESKTYYEPEVRLLQHWLEIVAEDRFVDLIEEGFDLGIRITKLDDSAMIARKLSDFRVYACATPEFVEKHGPLVHPSELSRVRFLIDTNSRSHNSLRFIDTDGGTLTVNVSGPLEVNSPQATLRAARAGLGVAMIPDFIARPHIASGELVSLFDDFIAKDRGIYAVYPHRRYLPAKVRAFVDYLHAWFKRNA